MTKIDLLHDKGHHDERHLLDKKIRSQSHFVWLIFAEKTTRIKDPIKLNSSIIKIAYF